MKLNNRLLLLSAFFVLALPLMFTGTASAMYMTDGAVQHATNGGWVIPTDYVCVVGVHTDGTLDIADGVTNSRDCAYLNKGKMNGGTAFDLTTLNTATDSTGTKVTDVTASAIADITATSTCGTKITGPFGSSCSSSANCKYFTGGLAASWDATNLKCYNAVACASAPYVSQIRTLDKAANPWKCYDTSACVGNSTLVNQATNSAGTAVAITLSGNFFCYDVPNCLGAGTGGNDGARHKWTTSTCVDGSGIGVSLKGLDRTAQMCQAKGGIWKQTSATAPNGVSGTWPTPGYPGNCIAYGNQFKGQNAATGAPLAFGSKGTTAATAGYCYASMDMTTAYSTSATCPSVQAAQAPFNANAAYDWAWDSTNSKCTYAKSIKGYTVADLFNADGSKNVVGTLVDLSTMTTMGNCLAYGASWNNWVGTAASTTSVPTTVASTIPAWNYTAQAPDSDAGCLHCHTSTVEYNGPAEREKDSYVKTGHKNMLRKVSAGKPWAGPNALTCSNPIYTTQAACTAASATWITGIYTTDGTNTISFMTTTDPFAKITVSSVAQNLYYIYGDWMVVNPSVVYGTNGYGPTIGGTNNYTCGSCHTAGYSDVSLVCTVNPALNTTAAACTAAGGTLTYADVPGVQSIGTSTYVGVQPQASFPGINLGTSNPQWDLEGIQCARCHNAAVGPVNATMIKASTFTTTQPLSGGMGALANGIGRNGLCFGCHQSEAKIYDGSATTGTTTTNDPTVIPAGGSHGATYAREFNGHVLGESFLNSAHAQFTGTVQLNALGKYDLIGLNGAGGTYASKFKGYTCWQSPTSSNPAKTKDSTGAEIPDKTTCESLYGAGSWRADTGSTTTGASGILGTCTTCHDVHNSLFVASQSEAAIRKTCEDCHVNNAAIVATDPLAPQVVPANINHPTGAGTPFDTTMYDSACVVCHMATQAEANGNQNSMPVHLWRINSDPSYNTFPTSTEFYGGSCSVGNPGNAITPPQYTTDLTCPGTWTPAVMNRNAKTAPAVSVSNTTYNNAVWVDLDLACGQCHGGSLGASKSVNGAPYLTKAIAAQYVPTIHNVSAAPVDIQNNPAPVSPPAILPSTSCTTTSLLVNGNLSPANGTTSTMFTLTNSSTGTGLTTYVNWGDGTPTTSVLPFTHTYTNASNYQITETATDQCGFRQTKTFMANVTGGASGKGVLEISANGNFGTVDAFGTVHSTPLGLTYSVMAHLSPTVITSGTLVPTASALTDVKDMILDATVAGYDVTLQFPIKTLGTCSVTTTTQCMTVNDCPTGETCNGLLYHFCTGLNNNNTTQSVTLTSEIVPLGGKITIPGTACN